MPTIPQYSPGYGRVYYGPSLQDPRFSPQMWTSAEQEDFYAEQYPTSGMLGKGAAFAGAIAMGYAQWGKGRVWDLYARGARAIEEYSPAYILRTFNIAPFLSQFETPVRAGFNLPASMFLAEGEGTRYLAEYYASLIGHRNYPGVGTTYRRILTEGLRFEQGKLFWGQGKEVALPFASAIRVSPEASAKLPASWARIVGAQIDRPEVFFGKVQPFEALKDFRLPTVEGMPTTVVGGHTRGQAAWRHASAWGTAMVSRFNTLLRLPAQMPPFDTAFRKGQNVVEKFTETLFGKGIRPTLAVPESTGGRMMVDLLKKYGVYLPLAYMGYQTLDWLVRGSPLTSGTVFEEGLTVAAGTAITRANVLAAEIAQATGLQSYREWQESLAPGSTDFSRLMAFPIMGAMFGSGAAYALKVGHMARSQYRDKLPVVEARKLAEDWASQFGQNAELAKFGRYVTREEGLYSKPGKLGDLWRKIAKPVGDESGELSFKLFRRVGPVKLAAIVGGAAGLLSVLPFLPGSLIPEKSPEELERIYSGEQEVPIRRGRWWEFGRSAFEGQRIAYFRPHWYARMRMNAKEEGIWGDDAYRLSPIQRWFQEEFTYNVEDMHYYDRPYPITSLPFEDVPFVGPILAGTVGRLIKPERLMHEDEWMSLRGTAVEPPRFGQRVATEIGQTPGGVPESPYNTTGLVGEQVYRLQEMIGLPGFSMMSIKEWLTGTPDWFDQRERLESSRRMTGFERSYWDLELGGLMGTTEAFRRLFPHRRRQIPLYNPIPNMMPGWLPGPGEKSPDFLHGDPYVKVPEGELRLPGRGYEARFPELEGVAPEDYPLIHKYKILADVAPYTENFKEHLHMVRKARKEDSWSEYEERIYQQTQNQLQQRKTKVEFQEYQHLTSMGDIFGEDHYDGEDSAGLVGAINRLKADKDVESGVFSKYYGGYWELLSHNAETVLDQMTPMSPGSKLVHQRTAIEHYERMQFYGTQNAFWNHPFRDFVRPSFWLGAQAVGYEGVPSHIARRRELEEYFDILKYVKFSRLSNIARENQDYAALRDFESKKDETLFGLDPYTRNFSAIFRSLPRRDRDYFNAFAGAQTEEERSRILELVPRNEKALYVARWKLAFADEVRRAKKGDLLSKSEMDEADELIGQIYDEARTEGFPSDKELYAQYLETRMRGEGYGDWYRRTHLLTQLTSLPGPDWVGWHPSVDLDDVKLKVVQNWGEDMHEYDLWPSRAQQMVNKPYINQEAIAPIIGGETLSRNEIHGRINQLLMVNKMGGDVFVRTSFGPAGADSVNMQISQEPQYSFARREWF